MSSSFPELLRDFVSLIYPRYCLACKNGLLKGEELVCTRCIHELPRSGYHLEKENALFKRLYGRLPLSFAFAFLLFKKGGIVQHLLHELKYNNHPELGQLLGRVYGRELASNNFDKQYDVIIPIPLHPSKQKKRGYNQSAEFAKGLSVSLQVEYKIDAVHRTTITETQTRKTKLKRWENVSEVFEVSIKEVVKGKRILLVDDVITTGATVEACGQILLGAGCSQLSIASIAYAEE